MTLNKNWEDALTQWIHFRNSHSLGPVVVQSFMLLCAFLIIVGLVYVFLLVIAIAIHHFVYDRDPKRVPDFVKNSIQFSSSESDDDGSDNSSETADIDKGNKYASTARKLANLDKFMNIDTQSKMRAVNREREGEKDNG